MKRLNALTATGANGDKRRPAEAGLDRAAERDWIRRARQADVAAFESLYRLHVGRVYGLCLRMTGNASEAEDCTQDAFIQAWSKLEHFRGDSAFGTWLHRIAVNAVLLRMRASRRERERIEAVTDISPAPEATGDEADFEDLQQAVNELPDGARHVFVLHAVYGYSHEETGDMLGIAIGTSKAQLHRAKRLLANRLTRSGHRT